MTDMITAAVVAGALLMPPHQFTHEPTRAYSVQIVSAAEVEKHCNPTPFKPLVLGCTVMGCYIFLRNDMTADATRLVLRHEIAHVNGWEHAK